MAENKYEREVMDIIDRHGGTLKRHNMLPYWLNTDYGEYRNPVKRVKPK